MRDRRKRLQCKLCILFFFDDVYCYVSVGYICRCFGGYDGPNCELTARSFEPGEWIWLPPPQQCTVGSLSLEFASREANGLLLYGGPTSPVGNGDVHDFITVELSGGKILVSMSLGDPNDVVRLGVTSGMALNDGEWHHVEVFRDKTVNTFLLFLLFFGGVYLTFYLASVVFVTPSEPCGGEQITCERNTSNAAGKAGVRYPLSLRSWKIFHVVSARSLCLLQGHMTSNNETVSLRNSLSGQRCKIYDARG